MAVKPYLKDTFRDPFCVRRERRKRSSFTRRLFPPPTMRITQPTAESPCRTSDRDSAS